MSNGCLRQTDKRMGARAVAAALIMLVGLVVGDWGAAEAGQETPGELTPVTTKVRRVVLYNPRSAVSLCRLELANGRSLHYVDGADCKARPGQGVVLMYRTVRVCRPVCRPALQLATWWLR